MDAGDMSVDAGDMDAGQDAGETVDAGNMVVDAGVPLMIRNGTHDVSPSPTNQPCGQSTLWFTTATVKVTTDDPQMPTMVTFDWGLEAYGLTVTQIDTGPLTNGGFDNTLNYDDNEGSYVAHYESTDVGQFNLDGSFDLAITQIVSVGSGPPACIVVWNVHGNP
jgi:hypothetical protein